MKFKNVDNIVYLSETFNILKPLSTFYPDFNDWYWDKVVPGIILA